MMLTIHGLPASVSASNWWIIGYLFWHHITPVLHFLYLVALLLSLSALPVYFTLQVNYHDLKMIIKHESHLNDFILDNLVGDGDTTKKVRIGVADESEGAHLIKCLDGFRLRGNIISVIPVAKTVSNFCVTYNFSVLTPFYICFFFYCRI